MDYLYELLELLKLKNVESPKFEDQMVIKVYNHPVIIKINN